MKKPIFLSVNPEVAYLYAADILGLSRREVQVYSRLSQIRGMEFKDKAMLSLEGGEMESYALCHGAVVYRLTDKPVRQFRTKKFSAQGLTEE